MALDMTPLAWSPLGGGKLARGEVKEATDKQLATQQKLDELAETLNRTPVQVALAWLMSHPSALCRLWAAPNPKHIREAASAADLRLNRKDWFELWSAAWGRNPP
jgi:predicted oxidoreductase